MTILSRAFAAALLLTLAACGEPAAPGGQPPAAQGGEGPVVLATTRNMPDWLLVARQRDCAPGESCPRGEVHFNQRTITRNADGTADIWIQVRHGLPQLYEIESETTETTVRFELERLHYRFRCDTGEFIVVERQIMGAGETVVARDEPRPIYRAPVRGSATAIIMPIACRGQ
jgi:hypothetical protein